MSEARTEEATPRQERRARERGRVWQSRDLTFAAVLLVSGGLVRWGGSPEPWLDLFRAPLDAIAQPVDPRFAMTQSFAAGAWIALPWLAAIVVMAAIASAVQTGFLFAPAAITPDASRLAPSPGTNGARIGSTLALGLARLALLASVAIGTLAEGMPGIATLSRQPPAAALAAIVVMTSTLALRSGLALAAIGIVDAVVERALYLASLRMTRREKDREHREAEGDAHLRRERERVRDEMHREGDLDAVRAAALVVTGEDVAIAIAYDASDPDAVPRVSAIGRGARAEDIVREATAPIAADETLAASLAIVPIGSVIPESLYEPVARAMRQTRP